MNNLLQIGLHSVYLFTAFSNLMRSNIFRFLRTVNICPFLTASIAPADAPPFVARFNYPLRGAVFPGSLRELQLEMDYLRTQRVALTGVEWPKDLRKLIVPDGVRPGGTSLPEGVVVSKLHSSKQGAL